MTEITPGATMLLSHPDRQDGTGYTVVEVCTSPVLGITLVRDTCESHRVVQLVDVHRLHPVTLIQCSHDELDIAHDAFTGEPFHYCIHCEKIVDDREVSS